MAGGTVDCAAGAIITFDSGFIAEIDADGGWDWGGIERADIDVTHFGVAAPAAGTFGNALSIPSDISRPGALTVNIHFNPDTTPPIDSAAENLTLTFPKFAGDTTAAKWVGSAYMNSYNPSGSSADGKMTAVVGIMFSDKVTITAAA